MATDARSASRSLLPRSAQLTPRLNLPADAPEQERRLALSKWIADPQNPLTARVLVNRLWHYHFGEGLVNTPSDFGNNGARPVNQELLDWLASFVAQGWSLKNAEADRDVGDVPLVEPAPRTGDGGGRGDATALAFPAAPPEAEVIHDLMLPCAARLISAWAAGLQRPSRRMTTTSVL